MCVYFVRNIPVLSKSGVTLCMICNNTLTSRIKGGLRVINIRWNKTLKGEIQTGMSSSSSNVYFLSKTAFYKARKPQPCSRPLQRAVTTILNAFIGFWSKLRAKGTKKDGKCSSVFKNHFKVSSSCGMGLIWNVQKKGQPQ